MIIKMIGERQAKEAANQALIMRLAISSALSKEGAEVFQEFIDNTFNKPKIISAVDTKDLAKFGLEKK